MGKYKTLDETELHRLSVDDTVSALDMIKTGPIGFCGCGSDDAMYLLRDILKEMQRYGERKGFDKDLQKEHENKMLEIVGGNKDGVLEFIYYWLDNKGFTEHGGSIPGWLEGSGDGLLHDLEIAISDEESHNVESLS